MAAKNFNTSMVRIPASNFPLVALQVPGRAPVVIYRDKFLAVIKGINITSWAVDIESKPSRLEVTHKTGRVKGRYVFYNLNDTIGRYQVLKITQQWSDNQRKQRAKKAAPKINPAIKRLQRELENKMYSRPHNPLTRPNYLDREPFDYSQAARDRWQDWYASRPRRCKLAKIAGLALSCKITDVEAYRRLRELFPEVKTYSQLTENTRRRCGIKDRADYWKALPRIVSGWSTKPFAYSFKQYSRAEIALRMADHATARLAYVCAFREVQALNIQIETMTALVGDRTSQQSNLGA
jgi:hypothetical protein